MPSYVKSTFRPLEKSAEGEAKSVTQTAENKVQDLVDENGQSLFRCKTDMNGSWWLIWC